MGVDDFKWIAYMMIGRAEGKHVNITVHVRFRRGEIQHYTTVYPRMPGKPFRNRLKKELTCILCGRVAPREQGTIKKYKGKKWKTQLFFCSKECYIEKVTIGRNARHNRHMCLLVSAHEEVMKDDPEALGGDIEKFLIRPLNCKKKVKDNDQDSKT